MTFLALTLSAVLAQTAPTVAAPQSATDKAVDAAERAAAAAEKAANAAERIANAVAPQPPPPAPGAPAPAGPPTWGGSVGLGATFITGNAQTLTLTANVAADRKWDVWALGIRVSGAYGTANPGSGSSSLTTARRAGGSIRGDRSFTDLVSLYVLGSFEFDHMKNIEARGLGEFGTGLTFFNLKQGDLEKLFLRLDIAMRAGYETHYQYFGTPQAIDPYGATILAPRAGLLFRWGVSKDVRISEEVELIPYLLAAQNAAGTGSNAGRLLINSTTKINARLTEMLSLSTGVVVNYDSSPPQPATGPQRVNTDVALTVGVEAAF